MEWLVEAFDFIISTITSVWEFFTGLLENIGVMLEYVGIVAELCYSTIASLPSWLQAFGTITILISTLYMILGREGGKSD